MCVCSVIGVCVFVFWRGRLHLHSFRHPFLEQSAGVAHEDSLPLAVHALVFVARRVTSIPSSSVKTNSVQSRFDLLVLQSKERIELQPAT